MDDLEKREKTIQTTPRDAESTLAILLVPGPGTQMTGGTAGAENVNIPCKKRMVLNTFQQTGGQGHHSRTLWENSGTLWRAQGRPGRAQERCGRPQRRSGRAQGRSGRA